MAANKINAADDEKRNDTKPADSSTRVSGPEHVAPTELDVVTRCENTDIHMAGYEYDDEGSLVELTLRTDTTEFKLSFGALEARSFARDLLATAEAVAKDGDRE